MISPNDIGDPSLDEPDPEDTLDAFGHLTWTVQSIEEPRDGGDWMACFDAVYCEEDNRIYYHVVVDSDSSGFTDTLEQGSVSACDSGAVTGLKSIPESWFKVGQEAIEMDSDSLPAVVASWSEHIDDLAAQAISREEEDAVIEQSADYFNHYVAGDR